MREFSRIVDKISASVLLEEARKARLRHAGDRGRLRHSNRRREIVDDIRNDIVHNAERLLIEGGRIVGRSKDLLLGTRASKSMSSKNSARR